MPERGFCLNLDSYDLGITLISFNQINRTKKKRHL